MKFYSIKIANVVIPVLSFDIMLLVHIFAHSVALSYMEYVRRTYMCMDIFNTSNGLDLTTAFG